MITFEDITYPLFKKGQVLKDSDLNNLVKSLDEQNRLTRVLVVGSGIFSGLDMEIETDEDNVAVSINITEGFGISSDGFIIQLNASSVTEVDNNDDVQSEGTSNHIKYRYYKKTSVPASLFKCQMEDDDSSSWDTWELLSVDSDEEGEGAVKVLPEIVNEEGVEGDYCLVLWVKEEERERPYCIDMCDNSGADLIYSIKALLVKSSDLKFDSDQDLPDANTDQLNDIKSISIPPFGYADNRVTLPNGITSSVKTVDLSQVQDYNSYYQNYREIIRQAIGPIQEALIWSHDQMILLGLGGASNPFEQVGSNLEGLLEEYTEPNLTLDGGAEKIDIQYFYGYLHDIKKAYEEFIKLLCGLDSSALPDTCAHIRHLAIGGIEISTTKPYIFEKDGCRSHFVPSQLSGVSYSQIANITSLYNRLIKLTDFSVDNILHSLPLNLSNFNHIKVTPGRCRAEQLSKLSIPYYYDKDKTLPVWSGDSNRCPDSKVSGYHFNESEHGFPDVFKNWPVLYQDDEFNFFRIEGHLGKKTEDVYNNLRFWVDTYNLPISVKHVFFNFVDTGDIAYLSPEMRVIGEKYSAIRSTFINEWSSKERDLTSSVASHVQNYNCHEVRRQFNDYYYGNDNVQTHPECYINALQTLHLTYEIERETYQNLFHFHEFAAAHPGMQHLGGAPKGGTFVVVSTMPLDENLEAAISLEKKLQDTSLNDTSKLVDVSINFDLDNVNAASSHISNQVVVGDFALPYICCDSDRAIDPLIILVPNKFCGDDPEKYEIFVYPKGGTVLGKLQSSDTGSDAQPTFVEKTDAGKYFFVPGNVPIAEDIIQEGVTLTYHIGGLSSKVSVIVNKKPETPAFTIQSQQPVSIQEGVLLTFSLDNPEPGNYSSKWIVDGQVVYSANGVEPVLERIFNFANDRSFMVSHVLENGICESRYDRMIKLCSRDIIGEPELELSDVSFTESPQDDETLLVKVNPLGGVFRMRKQDGDYFELNAELISADDELSGSWSYRIYNYAKDPMPRGTYTLYYYLPVCNTVVDEHEIVVESDPYVALKKYNFCSIDQRSYRVYINPAEGVLTADRDEVLHKDNDSGHYFFSPSGIDSSSSKPENLTETVNLTLSYNEDGNEITTSKSLIITRVPEDFNRREEVKLVNDPKNPCSVMMDIQFEAGFGVVDNGGYKWQVDGIEMLSEGGSTFNISLPLSQKSFEVRMMTQTTIGGRLCNNEILKGFNLCELIEEYDISVEFSEDVIDEGSIRGWTFEAEVSGGVMSLLYPNGEVYLTQISLDLDDNENFSQCGRIFRLSRDVFEKGEEDRQPISGVYHWQYTLSDCPGMIYTGEAFEYEQKSEEGEEDNNLTISVLGGANSEVSVSESDGSAVRLINTRSNDRKNILQKLEEEGDTLKNTKTFKLAQAFKLFMGDENVLHERFKEASDLIISSWKKVAEGQVRKEQYFVLLKVVTQSYLDKIIMSGMNTLDDASKASLGSYKTKLKTENLNVAEILTSWKAEDIRGINPTIVDEISSVLS